MTDIAQRVAIAEACGWEPCHKGCDGKTWRHPELHGCQDELPDYLNDLNAMHEAEKTLDVNVDSGDSPRYKYASLLYGTLTPERDQPFRATARQRAEAFLRTIGKWEES